MDFEQSLVQTPLPDPPPQARTALLARARRERRWRTIERVWGWTLATAAALLLVLNLHFGRMHERELLALTGPSAIERTIDSRTFANQFHERQRLLAAWLSDGRTHDAREERF